MTAALGGGKGGCYQADHNINLNVTQERNL
jgi:hypothetical protein